MINFKTENEPKMKFFDFGAFQKIEKMPSHDKILFHMLFGAFHDTSCIKFSSKFRNIASKISQLLENFWHSELKNLVFISVSKNGHGIINITRVSLNYFFKHQKD